MKLGAEPKKIAFLGGLLLVAAFLLYRNVFSGNPENAAGTKSSRVPTAIAPPADLTQTPAASRPAASGRRSATQEFRPPYRQKASIDPSSIDPRLRLDLLAKVQSVEPQGATRNLFQFGAAEIPALAIKEPNKIIPKTPADIAKELAQRNVPPGPVTPPPPAITLKYYGYVAQRADGRRRAFFLDGDDILVAAEGELLKRRYKVVRIGVNSAIVEDTQFNNTQTIPLQEEAAG